MGNKVWALLLNYAVTRATLIANFGVSEVQHAGLFDLTSGSHLVGDRLATKSKL